jgi:hypothetical protein
MPSDKNTCKNLFKLIIVIESVLFSLLLAIVIFLLFFSLEFYLHESGHILGGMLNDVITGNAIRNYSFSRWIPSLIPLIPMPQQTQVVPGFRSPLFVYGGMYFAIASVWIGAFFFWRSTRYATRNRVFFIPLYVTITQIINNYLCGTDNEMNRPLEVCHENILVAWYFHWHVFLLLLIFFFIVFPHVLYELPYLIDRARTVFGCRRDYL